MLKMLNIWSILGVVTLNYKLPTHDWDIFAKLIPPYSCLKCIASIHENLGLILGTPIFSTSKIHKLLIQ